MQKTYIVNQKNKDRIIPASLTIVPQQTHFLTHHGKLESDVHQAYTQLSKQVEVEDIASLMKANAELLNLNANDSRLQQIIVGDTSVRD